MVRQRNTSAQTKTLKAILAYVTEYKHLHGYSPTYREIANAIGVKSTSTVSRYIQMLIHRGLLTKDATHPRTLTTRAKAVEGNHELTQKRICLITADGGKVLLDYCLEKPKDAPVRISFSGILDAQHLKNRVSRVVGCQVSVE